MKKLIFTVLLFSAALMQCSEELPVSEDFPIVFTTKITPTDQGFRFEGKLIDDSGYKILTYGFVYASDGREFEDGAAIVYELGNPGNETFTLNTPSIGQAPTYACRAFVTYMKNSTKLTVYGNKLSADLKVEGDQPVWNLKAANQSLSGTGEGVGVVFRGTYIFQQDGKVTRFDGKLLTSGALDFPLNTNQSNIKLYSVMPFVLSNQNNNLYALQKDGSWAVITQLPFDHGKLDTGDVYIGEYFPYLYIYGSFGTYIYDYRDNVWETRTALPLTPDQVIVTGAFVYNQHYILTTDGKIQRFNGSSPPSLFTTFPGNIEGEVKMIFVIEGLYLYILSGQKMWKFDVVFAEWKEVTSFPETLYHPIYFSSYEELYVANKKANGNYDVWAFSQFE